MKCSECGGRTRVINTAFSEDDGITYRQRLCLNCGRFIYTEEYETADTEMVRRNLLDIRNQLAAKNTRQKYLKRKQHIERNLNK